MVHAVTNAARRFRHRFIPSDAPLVTSARAAAQWALACVPWWSSRGVAVPLGGTETLRVAPELLVGSFDFSVWGTGRNAGFHAWVAACRGKRIVVDIGAHIGLYAIPASRVLASGGHCYAFEPAAANAAMLRRHLTMNGCANVEVIPALVGECDANRVSFFEQPTVVGMNSVVVRRHAERYTRTERPQVALDTFCSARSLAPEVVKIDVEGGELGVLRGAAETLTRHRPIIVLSVHPEHLRLLGASVGALEAVIRDLGYTVREVTGAPAETLTASEYLLLPMS